MNILLIYFALPIATIILAAVLQKVIKCPIIVAAIFFALYLVVTFAAFDETFLIATIAYTILAFVTAVIVNFICRCNNDNDDVLGIRDVIDAINNCRGCNGENCNNNANSNVSTCNCRINQNGNINNTSCSCSTNNNNSCNCSAGNSSNSYSCNANSATNSSNTNGCIRKCRFR